MIIFEQHRSRIITIAASVLAGGAVILTVILIVSTPSLTDRFQALYEQVMRMRLYGDAPLFTTTADLSSRSCDRLGRYTLVGSAATYEETLDIFEKGLSLLSFEYEPETSEAEPGYYNQEKTAFVRITRVALEEVTNEEIAAVVASNLNEYRSFYGVTFRYAEPSLMDCMR